MNSSLIIPCYNEFANLPLLLDSCKRELLESEVEIILVDNGSNDKTPQVLKELLQGLKNIRSIRVEKNQGYGHGILQGLRSAKGDILGWTHADLQTNPEDFLKGMEFFKEHDTNIFVKGNRLGRPFSDIFFTMGMSAFEGLLLGYKIQDVNAQPTMFHRCFFKTWNNPPKDFSLDLYAYYQAHVQKLKIHRFPVKFGKRVYGTSHWNINWKEKIKFIRRTMQFSLQLKKNIKNENHTP